MTPAGGKREGTWKSWDDAQHEKRGVAARFAHAQPTPHPNLQQNTANCTDAYAVVGFETEYNICGSMNDQGGGPSWCLKTDWGGPILSTAGVQVREIFMPVHASCVCSDETWCRSWR